MAINSSSTQQPIRVGIIGGGIAGSTIALRLAQTNAHITLFEEGTSLVNGPPVCHLHAGGNLYPDISEQQCMTLLEQSIATMKLYPQAINKRPTVIVFPQRDDSDMAALLPRLQLLQRHYQQLIRIDASNQLLGAPEDYYRLVSHADMLALRHKTQPPQPNSVTDWLIPLAKKLDFSQIKFPLVLVQEYGLSLFRIAASTELSLNAMANCQLLTNNRVTQVAKTAHNTWLVSHRTHRNTNVGAGSNDDVDASKDSLQITEVDYLINACGYRTGVIDDLADAKKQRMVEFKAAYISHWPQQELWPEVIFHGKRGTPHGMAQLTPYPDGYFQLHGMTEEITLFKDGLAKSSATSAQPQLAASFISKLEQGWPQTEVEARTTKAIAHLAHFIPNFANAKVAGKPLFGAQQIPGDDISLRAYDVSFANQNYARAEIVKASSALPVAEQIMAQLDNDERFPALTLAPDSTPLPQLSLQDIRQRAIDIAVARHYPPALAKL